MFIKIVIVLLLLIVAVSLLTGRGGATRQVATPSRVRPMMQKMALILLALGAAIAIVHLAGCSPAPSAFHATEVKEANYGRLATLDTLTDHTGRRLASADFRGKAVVVFFGYTQCPDICPTTLVTMKEAMTLLGADAERVQVLFVTVDPERDTQEVLAGYVPWFDARFLGLYGDEKTTLKTAKEFRVFFTKVKSETALGYSIDHSATSYAYDPQGRLRLLIRHGETPAHIAADLRQLLAGK
ncbi:MAG: SCO family protein [Rhodocyclaceae bacterium]|nr:SCO family protein [Rhodocyclaceae bacterium]MDZ4214450.1 SCO family protein [Rhodocyclaceae bacterium]